MRPSKVAVWRAMDSEHAERLIEITMEHMSLVRQSSERIPEVPFKRIPLLPHDDKANEIVLARIDQLRKERNSIIMQFEDETE